MQTQTNLILRKQANTAVRKEEPSQEQKEKILKAHYNSPTVEYFGTDKTIELITRN